VVDSFYQPVFQTTTYVANTCRYIAASNNITGDELLTWNSSLSTNQSACNLAVGYSYCVEFGNNSKSALHISLPR
jgi:hypothetical protein